MALFMLARVALLGSLVQRSHARDILEAVDPLIGTVNGGHVFPGATLPFGMAKAVADVNTEIQGGFASDDGEITGFSHMHDSGTGGAPSLGNFPLWAQTGCLNDDISGCVFTKTQRATKRIRGSARASPGYFAVSLNTSVRAEMTVSNHSALYRFTFPKNSRLPYSPLILVDMTDLQDSRQNASMEVDAGTGRITGSGMFKPSFGIGSYNLHVCVDFHGASIRDTGIFMNNRGVNQPKRVQVEYERDNDSPLPAGAWARFQEPDATDQIMVRVGLSFMSVNKACRNAEEEIADYDFAGLQQHAEEVWRDKLSVIQVDSTGIDWSLQRTFWSGVYRTMISPQDYTGENPLWESSEPYYDSFYCIWDSFRSLHPLLTLLDPHSQTLMVRSLIDIYRHEGKLPDCRMSMCKGYTQGGSNADVVLADAYVKGLRDGIDWKKGYEAVVSDAEDEPPDWSVSGRGGLLSWKTLHYIPIQDHDPYGVGIFTRSISRTVEYAYNDFCISLMSASLNRPDEANLYRSRSKNWLNLFNPDQKSFLNLSGSAADFLTDSGFTGFLQPRYLNGSFGFQDPALCSGLFDFASCYLNPDGHETYEGSPWLYTFFAPHDMATLISSLGGPEHFVSRLQYLHDTSGLLYIGDEQAFLPVFLFHYAGRPALSAVQAHRYIPSQFNDTLVGIPGNDDSGAMGSFSTLAMMGLWPVAGQDVYLITPPFFREVNVTNRLTQNVATIRVVGFDAEYKNVYIQSTKRDGKAWTRNWIDHSFWRDGGVLELVVGPKESETWGRGPKGAREGSAEWRVKMGDLPPSMGFGGY